MSRQNGVCREGALGRLPDLGAGLPAQWGWLYLASLITAHPSPYGRFAGPAKLGSLGRGDRTRDALDLRRPSLPG